MFYNVLKSTSNYTPSNIPFSLKIALHYSLIIIMNIKTCKTLLKVIFYLVLFGLFMKFYFIEEIQEYLDGKTTFVTSYETRPIQVPSILLCASPDYKENTQWLDLVKAGQLNLSLWDTFQDITYNLDKDFELINIGSYAFSIGFKYGQKLKKGMNSFDTHSIELKAIPTGPTAIGMCHLITISLDKDDFDRNPDFDYRGDTQFT